VLPIYTTLSEAIDIERMPFVEIRDRLSREVITAIELLSPSSKHGDRERYLGMRRSFLRGPINLVEIDLLRSGARMPLEELPLCDYYVMVSTPEERPRVGIWPIHLREALPEVSIPLRPHDQPARLDLQQILNRVFDAAGYEHYIYAHLPQPPLSPEDAAWAQQLLQNPQSAIRDSQ